MKLTDNFPLLIGRGLFLNLIGCLLDTLWKESCNEILDPELYERCTLHFDGVFSALPDPDGPCIVHMDFRHGDLLVIGYKATGIIDFESARGGSSEIDFTKMNRYIWRVNPRTELPYLKDYQTIRGKYCCSTGISGLIEQTCLDVRLDAIGKPSDKGFLQSNRIFLFKIRWIRYVGKANSECVK
ncbi:hypothetical protein FHS15_004401 [Paenibacillus castaneae]|uniref:phosphotransferase n=1 Tax=Paenibacillus castaneae TaxID=474957 RepID=UPI000C9988BB|nr:hypothetical protein [Paenibacillus castaneae]